MEVRRGITYYQYIGIILFFFLGVTTFFLGCFIARQGSIVWANMNAFLLVGTVTLAMAVFTYAYFTTSFRDALLFFIVSCLISTITELTGTHWGIPFGSRYHYHPDLTPRMFGCVPIFIPIAWFVIAYAPLVYLNYFGIYSEGRLSLKQLGIKASLCAFYIVSVDLCIDPLSVSLKAWTWTENGSYYSVPVLNFLGWFLVGLCVYIIYLPFEQGNRKLDKRAVYYYELSFMCIAILMTVLGISTLILQLGHLMPGFLVIMVIMPYWIYWFRSIIGVHKNN